MDNDRRVPGRTRNDPTPLLFSYGTLQEDDVQRSTFGRLLQGQRDVSGNVFEVTDAELAAADQYEERAAYKRVSALLASGKTAWVYISS